MSTYTWFFQLKLYNTKIYLYFIPLKFDLIFTYARLFLPVSFIKFDHIVTLVQNPTCSLFL